MRFMFAQQQIRINMLLEMLKSREMISESDVDAFEHLAKDENDVLRQVTRQYAKYGSSLGLDVATLFGIDQLPTEES